jgi:hypothetical protein
MGDRKVGIPDRLGPTDSLQAMSAVSDRLRLVTVGAVRHMRSNGIALAKGSLDSGCGDQWNLDRACCVILHRRTS